MSHQHLKSVGVRRSKRTAVCYLFTAVLAVISLFTGVFLAPGAAMAAGSAPAQVVSAQTPLITKVTKVQPLCKVASPKLVVYTSTDLILGYSKTRTGPIVNVTSEVPAGKHTILLPAMRRGTSTSWYLVAQVLDDKPLRFGPFKFSRLSNASCLVRFTQPTVASPNPRALVHLESGASFGYAKSRTSAINWVKSEQPAGWYTIKFPAMRRGTISVYYIVLSFTDDRAGKLYMGPFVSHRP